MDPNATWIDLKAAVKAKNGPEAIKLAGELIAWIEKDGFLPEQMQARNETKQSALSLLRLVERWFAE